MYGTCKACHWYEVERAGEAVGVRGHCLIDPPTVMPLPQQIAAPKVKSRLAPSEEPQVGIFPVSVNPYVAETHRCSRWKGRDIQ